jgi:hypothetical protein
MACVALSGTPLHVTIWAISVKTMNTFSVMVLLTFQLITETDE